MASSVLFFRGRSSLHLFFGISVPKSAILGISGLGKVAAVSVMMSGWQLSLYVAPSYRSSSFIVLGKNWVLLVQDQKYSLSSQWTGPGSQYQLQAPDLVYFKVSCLCTSWYWRLAPCSHQSGYSINHPQVGRMVSIQPPTPYPWYFLLLCWIHVLCLP